MKRATVRKIKRTGRGPHMQEELWSKNHKARDHLRGLTVDRRIILKWVLNE
jgi:hypothetical protein